MAMPETSVSRHPFLPHEQMISLSKKGISVSYTHLELRQVVFDADVLLDGQLVEKAQVLKQQAQRPAAQRLVPAVEPLGHISLRPQLLFVIIL